MSNVIQNLSEITDSREMLEARPHKFTSIFAYVLIALLAIALIWSYFGKIDIVVKTNGVVKSNEKTISVLNEVDGKVDNVNFKEGQSVKEGDILYTLDCKDVILNKDNYEKQLEILENDTENINKLRKSILENKSYFDANNLNETEYYNKYLEYSTTNEKLLLTEKQTDLEINATNDNKLISSKSFIKEISENNDVINSLNRLLESIYENENKFLPGDELYYSEYTDYQLSIENIKNSIEQKKLELQNAQNKYTEAINDYKNQINNAEAAYNNSILKLQQYKSGYISQIEESITKNKNSLSDAEDTYSLNDTKVSQIEKKIDNLQLLVESINSAQNLFTDPNSTYYKQYVDYTNNLKNHQGSDEEAYKNSYLMKINESIDDERNTLDQLQPESSSSDTKSDNINKNINNLKKLRLSISENTNYFSESNKEYYNKFLEYQNNVSELQNNINTQKDLISSLESKKYSIINDYENQISITEKVLEGAQTDLGKYKNKSALDIKSKLDDANKSTEKLQTELEKSKITSELDDVNNQLATNDITKYKMDTLVKLDDNTKENELKLDELKTNIQTLQFNVDKSTVKATIDGVVNVKNDIAKGQLVKSGEEVLSVIPKDNSQYKVQLYVSNKDINGMKVGEKTKYHFQALPYKEYGELIGVITDIAVDSTIEPKTGVSYYLVESEIENKPLFSYKGETGELKIGMNCEAQVITKQKKILYYLLEKMNLKK
ncbi:HlyD family efflux transporter periplasmic adaptor subunit [Clostridium botulinum]|uniref:HlyD family efflux transporter periplasmic adaptor subunit n=1 Tax=Clostridium botulinum TaxID=1491 RepID=A0A6M0SR23_CLOBO|nr:HlyD family efflux transporter periplasmic adaptor subunit [Clostridium botulinum]